MYKLDPNKKHFIKDLNKNFNIKYKYNKKSNKIKMIYEVINNLNEIIILKLPNNIIDLIIFYELENNNNNTISKKEYIKNIIFLQYNIQPYNHILYISQLYIY